MTKVTVKYKPNHSDVRKFLNSQQVANPLMAMGQRVASSARSGSPVETGEYAASWKVSRSHVTVGGEERVSSKVENTSDHAAAVEWGYGGSKRAEGKSARRVLGRALEQFRG